ncbi:ATP-binding protein [Dokdonella sp. MW10]|uniref:ATP-binding protein n=1 Tax=Dokdonella sp. MW10 TaxID=2992926 RepID=UPI003F81C703
MRRIDSCSTILLGQIPVKDWHNFIDAPALADAILDRIIHSNVKIDLHGDLMRRLKKSGQ